LDNLSNEESSTNSSGFHSKSTTTLFNNEYSPKLNEINDFKFSGKKNKQNNKSCINKDYNVFLFSRYISIIHMPISNECVINFLLVY